MMKRGRVQWEMERNLTTEAKIDRAKEGVSQSR